MTGPADVDAYLAELAPAQRRALQHLRTTIRSAAPDATETISYQMPAFKDGGRGLVSYAAFTNHLSLFPMSTAVIEQHHDALAPFLAGKGTIRFTVERPLPEALVRKIVRARLAENAATAAATRRRR